MARKRARSHRAQKTTVSISVNSPGGRIRSRSPSHGARVWWTRLRPTLISPWKAACPRKYQRLGPLQQISRLLEHPGAEGAQARRLNRAVEQLGTQCSLQLLHLPGNCRGAGIDDRLPQRWTRHGRTLRGRANPRAWGSPLAGSCQTGNVLHRHYDRENNEVVELPVAHHSIAASMLYRGIYVVAETGSDMRIG